MTDDWAQTNAGRLTAGSSSGPLNLGPPLTATLSWPSASDDFKHATPIVAIAIATTVARAREAKELDAQRGRAVLRVSFMHPFL